MYIYDDDGDDDDDDDDDNTIRHFLGICPESKRTESSISCKKECY